MRDTIRKYVDAGRETLTPAKAQELAKALVDQGQARGEQVTKLARDLLEWSRKSSQRLMDTIGVEVKKQISRAGLATKEDLDSLKKRIRKLESGTARGSPSSGRSSGTTSGTTAASAPATKKGTGKKT